MRQIVLPLLLMASASTLAATVYKWVDANGVTHYSDQPFPGAKKIEVEAAQTYAAPSSEKATVPQPARKAKAPDGPLYAACDVFKPSDEESLVNVNSVTAKVRLDPGLRAGDRALIALDGKVLADVEMAGNEFTISPIYRGTHTVSAIVQNLAGNIVCQSDPITFYVRQASTLSPQSPLRPKPPKKP
jgi:hypothetical protein